jgi:putative redox protein
MAKEIDATLTLVDGMAFQAVANSGHEILLDSPTPERESTRGPTPMELLLMGTAGCTAMDVISILRKKRQQVTAYQVRIHGTRASEHPMVYTEITIEHIVTGHNISEAALAHAIELSDTKYCSASAMMRKTATITTIHRIIEAERAAGEAALP